MFWKFLLWIFIVGFGCTTTQLHGAPSTINLTLGLNNSVDLVTEQVGNLLSKFVVSRGIDLIYINHPHITNFHKSTTSAFLMDIGIGRNATQRNFLRALLLAADYGFPQPILFATFPSDETSFFATLEAQAEISAKNCVYFHVWPEILNPGEEKNALAKIHSSLQHVNHQNLQMNTDVQITWEDMRNKISRRSNFQGTVITAIAGDDPDYGLEVKFVDDKTLDVLKSGSAVEMFWVLRDTLNFTIEAIRGTWGEAYENGSMGGLLGEMLNGHIDICISLMPLSVESGPLVKLAYLQPTEVDTIRAFFVQPSSSAVRDMFLSNYSVNLRCVIVLIVLGMPIILRFVILRQTKRGGWFRFSETNLADEAFLWSLATFCQQGWHTTPHFVSTKIVFTVGYFTALICYVAFSAGIVSKLSVEIQPISDFEDLIRFDYVLFADKDTIPYQHILPNAFYRSFTTSSSTRIPESSVQDMENDGLEEGMDLTRAFNQIVKTKSALLSYDDVILMSSKNINSERLLCDVISSLPATKKEVPFSMIVKQDSPYREFFNSKIMLMKERGLNRRFDMLYNDGVKQDCGENTNKKKQLGLSDLFSAFAIMSAGFLGSCLILFAEGICKLIVPQKPKTVVEISTSLSSIVF